MFQCTVESHPTRAPLPWAASPWRLPRECLYLPTPPPPINVARPHSNPYLDHLYYPPLRLFLLLLRSSLLGHLCSLPFSSPGVPISPHHRICNSEGVGLLLRPAEGPDQAMEPSGADHHDATSQSNRHGDDAQQQPPDGESYALR